MSPRTPTVESTRKRIEANFMVEPNTGCWLWLGACDPHGYGRTQYFGNRSFLAHRAVYLLFRGQIPGGLELDHLCRTPTCVNPDHLEPVTHQENMRRSPIMGKGQSNKTHCARGHEYSDTNTMRWRNKRSCRTCMAAACKRWRAKNEGDVRPVRNR